MAFNYNLNFKKLNFRKQPELYRVGRGEQGVLLVEPYKSEILPHWRFKTPEIARMSATKIYKMFLEYKRANDFVGMDMARKFLQMGFTRARRYANHSSGRKYKQGTRNVLPIQKDSVKAAAAAIFLTQWQKVERNKRYIALKKVHQERFESR